MYNFDEIIQELEDSIERSNQELESNVMRSKRYNNRITKDNNRIIDDQKYVIEVAKLKYKIYKEERLQEYLIKEIINGRRYSKGE